MSGAGRELDRWVRSTGRLYDLGATLALVALIGALLTVSGLAHSKLESDRGIAALQAMRDEQADLISRMQDEGEPGYRIRFAEARLQAMDKMLQRAKADEQVVLDQLGRQATKDALTQLLKGPFLNDIASLGDLAFDTALKISDAYHGTTSEHQKRLLAELQGVNDRLRSAGSTTDLLQGNALDVFIAAAELNHITQVIRDERGIDETDPVFANVLNRYLSDFYLREGERPLPAGIRTWVETIVAARDGDEEPRRDQAETSPVEGGYVLWVNVWPDYRTLGLDWSEAGDWVQAHGSEIGTLHVGTVAEVRERRTYAEDPVLDALIVAQCKLYPPEAITCDEVRATPTNRQPVTVQEGGQTTVPRFDTREEAVAWACARLRGIAQRAEIISGQRSEKVAPFLSARLELGGRVEPVILGNFRCP